MARVFSKKTKKKTTKKITEKELQNIIEKEFSDNQQNKIKFRFDFNPHSPDEPTIKWQRKYGETK